MSHYSSITVNFTDAEMLVAALVAVGIDRSKIEKHAEPQQLFDYRGNLSSFGAAHVIVRREHVGNLCNDLGFKLDKEKGSQVVVCDFARDRQGFNASWLGKVTREYAVATTKKHYEKLGKKVYRVDDKTTGRAHLFVRA